MSEKVASDSVKAFATHAIKRQAGEGILKDAMYETFKAYCQKNKLPCMTKRAFSLALQNCEEASYLQTAYLFRNGVRRAMWLDVKLQG